MDAEILEALKTVAELASKHVEDIETGIADGTYEAADNPTIDQDAEAVKVIEDFINSGKATEIPVIALTVDGTVHCVVSDIPVRVIGMNNDLEGGDEENIKTVFDQDVYITDITVNEYGTSGQDGVQPDHIERLLTCVDAEVTTEEEIE